MTNDHYNIFEQIVAGLADDGAKAGKMFGHPCLKEPNSKVAATYWHDNLLVKLPPERLVEVLAQSDISVFEPMKGRKMNGWAQVPAKYVDEWDQLVAEAHQYVRTL